jgi:hypothetical protein
MTAGSLHHLLEALLSECSNDSNIQNKMKEEIARISEVRFITLSKFFDLFKDLPYEFKIQDEKQRIYSISNFIASFTEYAQNLLKNSMVQEIGEIENNLKLSAKKLAHLHEEEVHGCEHRCPICGQKCDGSKGHEGTHHTIFHIGGYYAGNKCSHNDQLLMLVETDPTA